MSKLLLVCGLGILPLLGVAQGNTPHSNDWWDREVWSRLAYSGSRTLGYQNYKFEGDAETFGSLTNYGTGLKHFTDIGSFSVQGNKVFGLLDFRAAFTDNRFSDPEQQQYTLNYKRGFYDLRYGTIQASLLPGNRFINFSRSLKGFVGDYKKGRFEAKALTSTARGAARTVTIEGNNTTGPYYLAAGRIIGGSVKILLDGVELRQGVDYVVDSAVGSITFANRTIPPTSTIVASYESYDISGSGGTVTGVAAAYDLGKLGKIGLTSEQQKTGTKSVTNDRIELFQGFGNIGDQYALQFEPIPASIVVTVDGIVRTFSVVDNGIAEFYLSPVVPSIVISKVAVFSSQTLQIRYIPKLILTVDGDRSVTGFNWRLPLGGKGTSSFLNYSRATGRLSGSAPSSGDAQGVDLNLRQGKSEFKMGLRRIDPGFRTVEQTGFNRNEDVAEYSFNYGTKGIGATASTSNSLISINNGSNTSASRVVNSGVNLSYSDPTNISRNMSRSQSLSWTQTNVHNTDNTRLTTLGFKENYHANKLTFGYGVENLTGRGRVDGTMSGLGIQSFHTNATYNAGKNWAVTVSAAKSNVKTDKDKSDGYDYSLRANMAQTGPWTLAAEYALSDSGALASLGGFLNGNSLGFGNNGFGGSGGSGTLSTGQLKARRTGFSAIHQAGDNFAITFSYNNTTAIGSSTNNAKIDVLNLDASWRINASHTFQLDYSRVKSDFLTNSGGTGNSDVISGHFQGEPGKLWQYSLGYNILKSSGAQLSQDNLGLSFGLNYLVAARQRLFFNAGTSKTRGLYPQNDKTIEAGYGYMLGAGIGLVGKYSYRNLENLDPGSTGGAFRAKGFSIELKFDLASRR